jgi:hypothetical protein
MKLCAAAAPPLPLGQGPPQRRSGVRSRHDPHGYAVCALRIPSRIAWPPGYTTRRIRYNASSTRMMMIRMVMIDTSPSLPVRELCARAPTQEHQVRTATSHGRTDRGPRSATHLGVTIGTPELLVPHTARRWSRRDTSPRRGPWRAQSGRSGLGSSPPLGIRWGDGSMIPGLSPEKNPAGAGLSPRRLPESNRCKRLCRLRLGDQLTALRHV